jgi:hypothetical protein
VALSKLTMPGLVVLGIALGAAVGWAPMALPIAVALIGGVLVAVRVLVLPLPVASVVGLLIFHFVTLMKVSWIDDQLGIFKFARMGMAVLLFAVLTPWRGARMFTTRYQWATYPTLFYFAWLLTTGLWVADPKQTLFYGGWATILVIDVLLVLAAVGDPRRFLDTWIPGVVIIGTAVGIVCLIVGALGVEHAYAGRWIGEQVHDGYRGIFHSPNVVSGQAAMAAGAAYAWRHLHRPGPWPRWLLPVSLLSFAVSLASLSRSGILGWLAGTAVFFWFERRRGSGFRVRPVQAIALGLLFVPLALRTGVLGSIMGRVQETAGQVQSGEEGRVLIWATYVRSLFRHPIIGTGFAGAPVREDRYALHELNPGTSGHNFLMDYGVLTGFPGLFLFCGILTVGVLGAWRHRHTRLVEALGIMVASTLPSQLFEGTAGPGHWGPFSFWVPLLLCASLLGVPRGMLEPVHEAALPVPKGR